MVVPAKLTAASLLRTPSPALCLHQVLQKGDKVAVVGDGKLGLLVAQVLVLEGHCVTHFGKHEHKLRLVSGTQHQVVTGDSAERHAAVSCYHFPSQQPNPRSKTLQDGSAKSIPCAAL